MKVEQPGCINEGTARGSDGITNEIVDLREESVVDLREEFAVDLREEFAVDLREEFAVDLREEFAAVDTRSRATIVIIHARRGV